MRGIGVARDQKISIRLVLVAAHPSAQLVEIAQTEAVGAVNDDRVRVGDVETALDDRR